MNVCECVHSEKKADGRPLRLRFCRTRKAVVQSYESVFEC